MEISVTVCNVCMNPARPTKEYTVGQGRRVGKADLCEQHAAFLETILAPPKRPAQKAEPTQGRRRGTTVVDMDEVEAARRRK